MKFKKKSNKFNKLKNKKYDDSFETNYEEEVLRNPTKWYEEVSINTVILNFVILRKS